MAIIISMTTTSQRVDLCRAAVMSLATQSVMPDKIILNLSKEAYLRDLGFTRNESDLLRYITSGLSYNLKELIKVNWVINSGPYRKLLPTLLNAHPDDIIVTADDDIFYDRNWLECLLKEFNPINKTIHAARVRRKIKNRINLETGYIHWPLVQENILMDSNWIITFGGGAVLSRRWFPEEILEDDMYLEIAPTSDDLWYSKICQHCNIKVKVVPEALSQLKFFVHDDGLVNHNLPQIKNKISKALYYIFDSPMSYLGVKKHGNDIAYDAINRYFKVNYK